MSSSSRTVINKKKIKQNWYHSCGFQETPPTYVIRHWAHITSCPALQLALVIAVGQSCRGSGGGSSSGRLSLGGGDGRLLAESVDNGLLERLGLGGGGPALNDGTVTADQELLKVPLDALEAQETRLGRLEPLVKGRGAVAVDVDLGEDGE